MGKLVYVMGKSAAGKDTIYQRLLEENRYDLKTVVPYTTRPIRQGEQDGREYFFRDKAYIDRLQDQGKIIEIREYQTVVGPWWYFTADDGQIQLKNNNYIMIGTLESYRKIRDYYGEENMLPIYITVEDGVRLMRSLNRETHQEKPNYAEVCRRFLADQEDFAQDKLNQAGIQKTFVNENLEDTVAEIQAYLEKSL